MNNFALIKTYLFYKEFWEKILINILLEKSNNSLLLISLSGDTIFNVIEI